MLTKQVSSQELCPNALATWIAHPSHYAHDLSFRATWEKTLKRVCAVLAVSFYSLEVCTTHRYPDKIYSLSLESMVFSIHIGRRMSPLTAANHLPHAVSNWKSWEKLQGPYKARPILIDRCPRNYYGVFPHTVVTPPCSPSVGLWLLFSVEVIFLPFPSLVTRGNVSFLGD